MIETTEIDLADEPEIMDAIFECHKMSCAYRMITKQMSDADKNMWNLIQTKFPQTVGGNWTIATGDKKLRNVDVFAADDLRSEATYEKKDKCHKSSCPMSGGCNRYEEDSTNDKSQ